MSVRVRLLAGAMSVALLPSVCSAQAQPAPDQAAGQSSTTGLQDIIVTASRRSVNLQKESRDIAVVSGEALARTGITEAIDVQRLTPGLTISNNGSQLQVSVRGVGDRTISAQTDPAVALNVDGVFYPRSFEAGNFFFDLDRIEVLKGPQGTLYGRNASAGAVNLITNKPRFEDSGYLEGELGNYSERRVTGAINLKASDAIAVRLSGQYVNRDGYLSDGFNDDKNGAVRLQVLIAPTTDTSLLLNAAYSHRWGMGYAATLFRGTLSKGAIATSGTPAASTGLLTPTAPAIPSDHWAGPSDPATLAYLDVTNPAAAAAIRRFVSQAFVDTKVYTMTAQFEHRFGWGTLTILPSFVGSHLREFQFASLAVPGITDTTSNQYAIEARLSSPTGSRINWVVGGFASHEDITNFSQAYIPIFPGFSLDAVSVVPKLNDATVAGFAETNISITPSFRVVAGGRYTWEHKTTAGYQFAAFNPSEFPLRQGDLDYIGQANPVTAPPVDGQLTDTAFNYRAGVEYDVTPTSMVYATASSGFKAGGFFAYRAPDNRYKPERLTAFSLGARNRFLDNRVQLNIEGFYWKYRNKQETFLAEFPAPYGNVLDTANAGRATLYGADASLAVKVTPRDQLSGEVEFLHTRYNRFRYDFLGSADPTINCAATTSAAGITTEDCSGFALIRAPKWSGHVDYQHTQDLGSAGRLILEAGMRFSSSFWLANNFTALTRQRSYQTYDASLTWETPIKRLAVTGWIRNIGNRAVYDGGLESTSITDAAAAQIEAPRTFGGRIRYSF